MRLIQIIVLITTALQCRGVSYTEQLDHIARRRLESLGFYEMAQNKLTMLPMRRFNPMHSGNSIILGSPSMASHLPEAEAVLPAHTLIRPAVGMLKSAIKFPHKDLDNGAGVYGNMDSIGIKYDGKNERIMYSGFRRMPSDYIMVAPIKSETKEEFRYNLSPVKLRTNKQIQYNKFQSVNNYKKRPKEKRHIILELYSSPSNNKHQKVKKQIIYVDSDNDINGDKANKPSKLSYTWIEANKRPKKRPGKGKRNKNKRLKNRIYLRIPRSFNNFKQKTFMSEEISPKIENAMKSFVDDKLKDVWKNTKEALNSTLNEAQKITNEKTWDGVQKVGKNTWNKLQEAGKTTWDKIQKAGKTTLNKTQNAAINTYNKIKKNLKKTKDKILKALFSRPSARRERIKEAKKVERLIGSSSIEDDLKSFEKLFQDSPNPSASAEEKTKKLNWFWQSKDAFSHVKLDLNAPEHSELVPDNVESMLRNWWFYHQDDFKPFKDLD